MTEQTSPKKFFSRREVLYAMLLGIVGIGLMVYFAGNLQFSSREGLQGQQAPDIQFELNGKTRNISKEKGTTLLVNFWASWCEPCMEEMPALKMLEDHFANQGLVLLAFNIEEMPGDEIQAHLQGPMPHNLVFDFPKDMMRPYNVNSIPLTVLIDKHGVIQKIYRGPRNWMSIDQLREIEAVLHN